MKTEKRQKKWYCGVTDVALLAIALFMVIGLFTRFHACGVKEDGTWMSCHWAEQTLKCAAWMFFALTVIHLLFPQAQRKQGIDFGILTTLCLTVIIPGRLISLCMMPDMACRRLMQPFALVCGVLALALSLLDMFVQWKRGGDR